MKTVKIRSARDIWFLNSRTGRTELLKTGVHTIVGEADYISLTKMFGSEIVLIEEPKEVVTPIVGQKVEEPVKVESKKVTIRKEKSK
ncbi:MAG: hypothetical protein SOZ42_00975 [Candidatus Enterosoma sp.]|nr:hypothetical protein [Candidatus Enterosoma sp.]